MGIITAKFEKELRKNDGTPGGILIEIFHLLNRFMKEFLEELPKLLKRRNYQKNSFKKSPEEKNPKNSFRNFKLTPRGVSNSFPGEIHKDFLNKKTKTIAEKFRGTSERSSAIILDEPFSGNSRRNS